MKKEKNEKEENKKNEKKGKETWIQKMRMGDSYQGNLYLTFVGIYLYVLFETPMTFYC